MTIQPGAAVYTQSFGTRPESVEVPHIDIRPPASTDVLYPIGKDWIDKLGQTAWKLVAQSTSQGIVSSVWVQTGGSTGAISSVLGTANQITVNTVANVATVSLPSAITTPGSLTTTTTLAGGTTVSAGTTVTGGTGVTATTGPITATNGNFVLGTSGNKILSTSVGTTTTAGANSIGSVTLASGTATVATTSVTASSLIITWRQSVGASTALGELTVGTITPATSFVISADTQATPGTPLAADLSVVGWMIIN